ncbi:MAG: LPS export ABC transporter periplasmic protein LptC [Bacteroidetes bacterium]|nr:LPS export ABC transporter periplasmic protein LptC [Bacteroidota bacterium]
MCVGSSCENDIEKVSLVTGKKAFPVETSKGLEILYSDSSKVKVKITAPEMNRFQGEKPITEMPKGVDVEFYDEQMRVNSRLTSKYALRKESENVMEAKNDVVVINAKGEKLNTEHLVWDEKNAKIYSKEFVKITTKDKIIFGNGFEANQDFTNYKIFNIKGTITINKDEHTPNP